MVIVALAEERKVGCRQSGCRFQGMEDNEPVFMLRASELGGFLEGFLWGMRANT